MLTREYRRCTACYGSGLMEAGGNIKKTCPHCEGTGKIEVINDDIEYLQYKETDSYKNAIANIKTAGKDITDEMADKALKNEIDVLKTEDRKKRKK